MNPRYTKEQHEFLAGFIPGHSYRQIQEAFNARFPGTPMTLCAVRSYSQSRHILTGAINRVKDGGNKFYSREVIAFAKAHGEKLTRKQLLVLVNETFGTEYKLKAFGAFCVRHGVPGRFEKLLVRDAKGRRVTPKGLFVAPDSGFKPGNTCTYTAPVGTEKLHSIGYRMRKTAMPNVWEYVHKLNWEAVNGKVPEGMRLIFLDGDIRNCEVGNLALVTKQELVTMNRMGYRTGDPELTRLGLAAARLEIARRSAEKKGGEK